MIKIAVDGVFSQEFSLPLDDNTEAVEPLTITTDKSLLDDEIKCIVVGTAVGNSTNETDGTRMEVRNINNT